jgi:hypothetical protein
MEKSTCAILTTGFGIIAIACSAITWVDHRNAATKAEFEHKQFVLLQAENDRLRAVVAANEKAKEQAKQAEERAQIERETSRIRGLSFKRPVTYDVVSRATINKVIGQKLSEQYSEAEFEDARLGYVALGLIPTDFNLKQHYIDLLGEQVAAFYDQHAHKLFMFEDASLANPQNRVILSHELTHALQDQNFGLNQLPLEIKTNDDRALAASALVEGDATLEMNQFMAERFTLKDLRDDVTSVFTQNLEQIRKSPRFLREGLLFPYTSGLGFCSQLFNEHGGFRAVSEAFHRPPASTAQILHPEKYFANEQPLTVDWPNLEVLGEKPIVDNVLGEFGTRILLNDWTDTSTAENASRGWRGDRYLVFNKGKSLVWRMILDNPDSAGAFSAALKRMLAKRFHFDASTAPSPLNTKADGHVLRIVAANPTEVVLVDAPDENWANALAEKFGQ